MRKETILTALIIGLGVFLMRWFRAFTPIEDYKIHFLPLFGIYFGMRWHFKKLKMADPAYQVDFLPAFWYGMQMSLIAAVLTALLCVLFVPYSSLTLKMFSPFYLHSFPFVSTSCYGFLVSILCASVIVYFKPIKIKPGTNYKFHAGQFMY
jgi:hypothetical protein